MISIIIPVYNTPKELEKCLRSLQRQTFRDFEVVVVDDGSEFQVSSFKFQDIGLDVKFYRISHGGAPKARNFGLTRSKGELILFCDADMELNQHCLAKMKKVLDENQNIDFVYSDFKYGWKIFRFWDFNPDKLKENNYINTCSMVRRQAVVSWDESLKRLQDWDFWLSVMEKGGKGKHIAEVLFKANVKRGKMSFWLPKFFYKGRLFKKLKRVRDYEEAKKLVQKKHGL